MEELSVLLQFLTYPSKTNNNFGEINKIKTILRAFCGGLLSRTGLLDDRFCPC